MNPPPPKVTPMDPNHPTRYANTNPPQSHDQLLLYPNRPTIPTNGAKNSPTNPSV